MPNLLLRPCAMSMDKWMKLNVHAIHILIGLSWNTQYLIVGITPEFKVETAHLLKTTWHDWQIIF